ncbi:MAG: phosphoadenylyl-sulfate reductase [Bacteroidales bacterium]
MQEKIIEQFRGLDAGSALTLASELFAGKVCFATSLGAEDQVILHMIATAGLPIRVFTLDTGRLFPETYDLLEKNRLRYKIPIEVYFPDYDEVEKMVNEKGVNLFYESIENRKLCCQVRKTHPLRRALQGMELWITGLRREQALTRNESGLFEWDDVNSLYKLNPLIDWTTDQVWDYIRKHGIPYNRLHDQGFPSIGCQPCTRAVEPGEDIRAGRWWWENPENRECGLHKR